MRKIRIGANAHAARLPSGEWLRVERWIEELSPSQDYTKPIYLDPVSIVLGELRCVIETGNAPWWVASARPPFDPEDRQFLYLLWQGSAEWLLRIARTERNRLPQSMEPLEVRLLPVPDTITDAPSDIEVTVAPGIPVVTVILPPAFPERLMTVDNSGEAILVSVLIDALLAARGHQMPDADKSAWLAEIMVHPNLKMLHVTPGGDYGFAADLVADRMYLRFLQQTDMAAAAQFMRDALAKAPGSGVNMDTDRVSGKEAVGAVLHNAVDVHWARCKAIFRTLDREQTLILLCRLIEAIHRERVSSERGAPARLQHYAESPEYELLARATMGRRDRTFQAYRVVAEMALCECPDVGGRVPELTDIDALAAEVATLIHMAHDSDAVERELVPAGLYFRPDGAMLPDAGGAAAFIQSYTLDCFGESVALDVEFLSQHV